MKGDVSVHEKVTAFQGMANFITLNPNGIRHCMVDFIEAVTHWDEAPLDLREAFGMVSIISLVK